MKKITLFWVIKNGVKLTAMPSWGMVHSDEEIWELVAFIKQLPNMTADEYQRMTSSGEDMPDGRRIPAHSRGIK